MKCGRCSKCLAWSAWLVLAAAAPSWSEAQSADKGVEVQNKIEPSVVYLEFWPESGKEQGSPGRGTGFVVSDPQKRNWIVTTAHSLAPTETGKKIATVRYRLSQQKIFATCLDVILDEKHDLAVLRPHPTYPLAVPPLELHTDDRKIPTPLYALGSEWALKVALFEGKYVAEVITVKQWADQLLLSDTSKFKPFAADATFVRHGIPIALGYSGCPIVTGDAKVIGIQSSKLEVAPRVGIAVHYKHIRDFDWKQKPVALAALDLTKSNADQLLVHTSAPPVAFRAEPAGPTTASATRPTTIKLGGVEVEAPLIHHGYVERDALTVIKKYIQDKEWYLTEQYGGIRILRLQQLLDRTRLARISNPLLGFQMLVPEGYRYSAQSTTKPDGMLVTFSPPKDRKVGWPYDWPVSMWVTVEPELFNKGRQDFLKKIETGELKLTPEEDKSPVQFALFRDRWTRAVVADAVDPRFALRDLDIRIKDQLKDGSVKFRGNPKSETFEQTLMGEGAWLRSNYVSTTRSLGHIVRIGSRDPLALIVHFQVSKENAEAFNRRDGVPDMTHHDYAILGSSFSSE